MNFDKIIKSDCIVPPAVVPDPRCESAEFSLANPAVCGNQTALIIRPSVVMLCQLESVDFRVFEYQNGNEVELTIGVRFTTSNDETFAVGINTGSGAGLAAGDAIITATYGTKTATAAISVLPGVDCCDEIHVVSSIVIDNSRSFGLAFGGSYSSRLAFGKETANKFVANQILVSGVPKDDLKVWKFSESLEALTGFSSDVAELNSAINSVNQTQNKTDLLQVFTTVANELIDTEADRRILFIVSDGEQTASAERQSILDAATLFKATGGIVMAVGVRASGNGFDLLERIATPGFFINATPGNYEEVLESLLYLKSVLCAGECVPAGDTYINSPSLDYSSFVDWEVIQGQVNLLGPGLLDLLPGNGLYVEMSGGSPALLRTIGTFDLVSGRTYSIAFKAAGNQREFIAGQLLKVYLREDGASASDPNVFEQTVSPAWDQDFVSYGFSFTAGSDKTVKLHFEQLGSSTDKGTLIDNVVLSESSTLTTLLSDNFDGENLTYIPPACQQSAGLSEVNDPEAPVVTTVSNGGDHLFMMYRYSYGYSWITNEGETAITPIVSIPFASERNLATRSIEMETAPDRAVAVRLWRSLGEIHSIAFSIAGTAAANGNYVQVNVNQWDQNGGTCALVFIEGDNMWYCYDEFAVVLYACTPANFPLGPWTVQSGVAPAPSASGQYAAAPTESDMFLLAELPVSQTVYLDSEGRSAFEARYEASVTAPDTNTTAVAAGGLGYGYYHCGLYECGDMPGAQTSDTPALPDVETGFTPPVVYTSTKTVCKTCPPGFANGDEESLVPLMTSATAPSGVVTSTSGAAIGFEAWKVFDQNPATYMDLVGLTAGFVAYQFPAAKIVTRYLIRARADYANGSPRAWTFQGSNNGTSWTTLDTRSNILWSYGQTQQFSVTNTTAYSYYRLNISANMSGDPTSNLSFSELEMFGTAAAQQICATATAQSYSNQAEADLLATNQATTDALAQLNCSAIYTSTRSYTAHCTSGFGADVTKSATATSLNSQEEADQLADAAAMAAALAELVCTGSNNEQYITINDEAAATPYPSVKLVENVVGSITKVTVSLFGFRQTFPDDVHVMLVHPNGTTNCCLMANCGGNLAVTSPINLVFDDAAAGSLPDNALITAGTYKPTKVGSDSYPSPAPTSTGLTLAVFNGLSPNGSWSLYVYDDLGGSVGAIEGGWDLTITAA